MKYFVLKFAYKGGITFFCCRLDVSGLSILFACTAQKSCAMRKFKRTDHGLYLDLSSIDCCTKRKDSDLHRMT